MTTIKLLCITIIMSIQMFPFLAFAQSCTSNAQCGAGNICAARGVCVADIQPIQSNGINAQAGSPSTNLSNVTVPGTTNGSTQPISSVGIDCRPDQMTNGTCSLSVYKLLGIRQSNQNPSPGVFINDIVLSATFFIGTIATLAIIYSGFMLVWNNATGNSEDRSKARGNIINALIGIALVSLSYTIIRLIQYLAAG